MHIVRWPIFFFNLHPKKFTIFLYFLATTLAKKTDNGHQLPFTKNITIAQFINNVDKMFSFQKGFRSFKRH